MTATARRKVVLGLTHIGFTLERIASELGWARSTIGRDRTILMRQHNARNASQLIINTWSSQTNSPV